MLRGLRDRHQVAGYLRESLVSRHFANRVHIDERFEQLRQSLPAERVSDYDAERCIAIRPNMTAGRERYARIAAATAVEARDPFLDKRVVEYCTRLPGRVLMKHGWAKMILREQMTDRLPDEVLWSRGKPHLGYLFNARITNEAFERGDLSLTRLQSELKDYVDSKKLANAWEIFRDGGDAWKIHSAYVLATWLRESVKRPLVPD